MVAYNFQAQFAPDVEAGQKRQTIRANGKRKHAQKGDKLQLYTGMRTKSCRKLRDAVCYDSCQILIEADKVWTFHPQELHTDLDGFAKLDGFSSWKAMREWFEKNHGLPFRGTMIRWLVPRAELNPASKKFNLIRCVECDFDAVVTADNLGPFDCAMCAGDSGREVEMLIEREAVASDQPEGRDDRTNLPRN